MVTLRRQHNYAAYLLERFSCWERTYDTLKRGLRMQLTRRWNRAYVSCSLRVNEHSYPDASRHRHTWTLSSETWHDRKI